MTQIYTLPQNIVQQLSSLRVFLSVAESGSIARAAEQIFKAPSAITRSIMEFEKAVGVSLFERKPRGMLLNAYGEAVLLRAKRIQSEIQMAADELSRTRPGEPTPSRSAVVNLLFNGPKLQFLIHLAALRNISSTAAHLGMRQAGASMALARIEAVLGQSLFQRRMEGMVATEMANRLVLRARRVFAELRHMGSDISAIAGNVKGSVVVGTTPLGRTHIFTAAIAMANAKVPGLRVITIESSYEDLIASLRSGDIDIVLGVLRPPQLCNGLVTEPLFDDRLSILVRAGHPLIDRPSLDVEDLIEERLILPRPNALARPLIEAVFEDHGVAMPPPTVETGDLAIIRQLLVESDMLAFTSPYQLVFELRAGSIVELPISLGGGREVGMIVRDGAMLSPAALAIADAVRDQARQETN